MQTRHVPVRTRCGRAPSRINPPAASGRQHVPRRLEPVQREGNEQRAHIARIAERASPGEKPGDSPAPGLLTHPHSPDPRQKDTIGLCPKNCEAKARMKYILASREPAWTGCGNVIANSARRRGFNDESRSPNRRRPIPFYPGQSAESDRRRRLDHIRHSPGHRVVLFVMTAGLARWQ